MKRLCRIWTCAHVGRAICCADCWMRDDCVERCLNWPSRCRCSGKDKAEYIAAEAAVVKD